jgi:hypothetical protein
MEAKTRGFKDLYNIVEESVLKSYELYVELQSLKLKNIKLEDTF